ncbi:MAG: VTT domain-containing protein [Terracidiphilus sp.]
MHLLRPLLQFIFRLGYFGPLAMGVLDSSFLVLPFGNDLIVVALVAHHRSGAPWYVLSAALGSTLGVFLLSLVSHKLGESGLRKIAGDRRYRKLKERIGNRAGAAVAIGGLAPPPFPFTTVIAAVSAIDYPIWRTVVINFFARALRFAVLAFLAVKYEGAVMRIAKSSPFEWAMIVFIVLCFAGSAFSIWRWLRRPGRKAR